MLLCTPQPLCALFLKWLSLDVSGAPMERYLSANLRNTITKGEDVA